MKDGLDQGAFEYAFDEVFSDRVGECARSRIRAIEELNEELTEVDAGIILRHSRALAATIAGWQELADRRVYRRDRELIEDLFGLLNDEVATLQKIALMVSPRRRPT